MAPQAGEDTRAREGGEQAEQVGEEPSGKRKAEGNPGGALESKFAKKRSISEKISAAASQLRMFEALSQRRSPSPALVRLDGLRTGRFVALDIETNGHEDDSLRVVEVGAVELVDGRITGREFQGIVKPDDLEDGVDEIHASWAKENPNFTHQLAAAKRAGRPLSDVYDDLVQFCGSDVVVCHGRKRDVPVDKWFLEKDADRIRYDDSRRLRGDILDTMPLAVGILQKSVAPYVYVYDPAYTTTVSLDSWSDRCYTFPPKKDRHTAIGDARALAQCLQFYFGNTEGFSRDPSQVQHTAAS